MISEENLSWFNFNYNWLKFWPMHSRPDSSGDMQIFDTHVTYSYPPTEMDYAELQQDHLRKLLFHVIWGKAGNSNFIDGFVEVKKRLPTCKDKVRFLYLRFFDVLLTEEFDTFGEPQFTLKVLTETKWEFYE